MGRGRIPMLVTVAVTLAAVAAIQRGSNVARAQTATDFGTVVLHVYQDAPIPVGDPSQLSPMGKTVPLLATCRIYVLPDMRGQRVPDDVNANLDGDPPIRIVRTQRVDASEVASIELAPGTYSFLQRGCFEVVPQAISRRSCCPNVVGLPAMETVRSVSGAPAFEVQTVTVTPGSTANLLVHATFESQTSRAKLLLILLILGAIGLGAIGAATWAFRPWYNPASDPDNPLQGPEPPPGSRPAEFDDVFGEFLRKR